MNFNHLNLTVLFSYGTSLKWWADTGILSRELLLYKQLASRNVTITLLTFGNHTDLNVIPNIDKIRIVPIYKTFTRSNNAFIRFIQSLTIPFQFKSIFKETDIIKTNQIWGSWIAVIAKAIYGKKLIVRCGVERFRNSLRVKHSFAYKVILFTTSLLAYTFSNHIIQASQSAADFIKKAFFVPLKKVTVLSNYIDTNKFKPMQIDRKNTILFVGRLSKVKNLFGLLDAVRNTPYRLEIIGTGELKSQIEDYIEMYNINAKMFDTIPNDELPKYYNACKIFILPSFYEGNPKVLLEAMACGCAVIGTNAQGISDIIIHNENGILCNTDSESINKAINDLIKNQELRNSLGTKAREYCEINCSISNIVEKELIIYKQLLNQNCQKSNMY